MLQAAAIYYHHHHHHYYYYNYCYHNFTFYSPYIVLEHSLSAD